MHEPHVQVRSTPSSSSDRSGNFACLQISSILQCPYNKSPHSFGHFSRLAHHPSNGCCCRSFHLLNVVLLGFVVSMLITLLNVWVTLCILRFPD
ncbi:hypothetical protein TNCV_2994391 [Trichonephila clavipes]|nr:hypothetical protein TNCV_2994391 [Trichonephila clavipes]